MPSIKDLRISEITASRPHYIRPSQPKSPFPLHPLSSSVAFQPSKQPPVTNATPLPDTRSPPRAPTKHKQPLVSELLFLHVPPPHSPRNGRIPRYRPPPADVERCRRRTLPNPSWPRSELPPIKRVRNQSRQGEDERCPGVGNVGRRPRCSVGGPLIHAAGQKPRF